MAVPGTLEGRVDTLEGPRRWIFFELSRAESMRSAAAYSYNVDGRRTRKVSEYWAPRQIRSMTTCIGV